MERLDTYDELPTAMREYLSSNGWHFNKAMFEWAASKMKDRSGKKVTPISKESAEAQLKTSNVTLTNNTLYDAVYVMQMALADYFGSSLKDMNSVVLFVKDYLDDVDGTPTRAMDEFMGKCIGAGCPIPWEDCI